MIRNLLFLAPYPDERYPKDGMISRISAIDSLFSNVERSYLYVSLRKNTKAYYKKDGNLEIYELNLFLHFILIIKILISAKILYSHSVHMLRNIFFLLRFFEGKLILDAHGVVPEEIEFFDKKNLMYYSASYAEKYVFKRKNAKVICVTNAMVEHFKNKYKNFKGEFYLYSIFPENLNFQNININPTKGKTINIIYSGSTAGWQNVDLMLKLIEENQYSHIKYTILTGVIEIFKEKLKSYKIDPNLIVIKSVHPSELGKYYEMADYGFILRDDNVVNRVANPTKLIEYMAYGIIPIVKSPYLGDYFDMKYEFLGMDGFNVKLKKPESKSNTNISLALKLKEENERNCIRNIVLN